MEIIKVARVPAILATADATVSSAVLLMAEKNVGAVVIVDADQKVAGIFTERDVLLKIVAKHRDADRTLLSEVMTAPVQSARSTSSAEEALRRMVKGHFRHMPIVDSDNRIAGIVSIRYLLMHEIGQKRESVKMLEALLGAGGPG